MDYDAIAQHFLVPGASVPVLVEPPTTPARELRDACEAVATIGWWSRSAAERALALGHDFFDGYVWGRAASLGPDVAPSVVVAAFGVFESSMLAATFERGRSISPHESILSARAEGASAGLAAAAAGVDEELVEAFAGRILSACESVDGLARPLFSGLRALPVPDDSYGRAWRAAELVREHRGDGHLAALAAAGLDMVEANVLTEVWLGYPPGEYTGTRGFAPDRWRAAVDALRGRGWLDTDDALTAVGRAARDEVEAMTDRSQRALVAALGDELGAVIDGGRALTAAVLRAHAAPSDPRKRAAG